MTSGCNANEEFLCKASCKTTPWRTWMEIILANENALLNVTMRCEITEILLDLGLDAASLSLTSFQFKKYFPVLESHLVHFRSSAGIWDPDEAEIRKKGRKILDRIFGRQKTEKEPDDRARKRLRVAEEQQ
jgi:hypothetical protein